MALLLLLVRDPRATAYSKTLSNFSAEEYAFYHMKASTLLREMERNVKCWMVNGEVRSPEG